MKIILLKGLPASGKTTFAKELINKELGKWKRVNKDDLRSMIDNGKWSKENETFVLEIRDNIIKTALSKGFSVLVDDTNLSPKHEEKIRWFAGCYGAEFEIKDFTDVGPEECIKRDSKRANSVGADVILKMYNQFLKPSVEPQKIVEGLLPAIICDIDGTLALFGKENPYDRDFSQDKLNQTIKDLLDICMGDENGWVDKIILVSGRKESAREVTEKWLKDNAIHYNSLFMRKTDDVRKDFIIKREIYEENIKGKYNIKFVLDDRDQTVRNWRELGLTCFQVANGSF
jgi:predicted kinase